VLLAGSCIAFSFTLVTKFAGSRFCIRFIIVTGGPIRTIATKVPSVATFFTTICVCHFYTSLLSNNRHATAIIRQIGGVSFD